MKKNRFRTNWPGTRLFLREQPRAPSEGGCGGGVSAPLLPENNAQIFPGSPKIFFSVLQNYFDHIPQIPENNTAAPQLPKSI